MENIVNVLRGQIFFGVIVVITLMLLVLLLAVYILCKTGIHILFEKQETDINGKLIDVKGMCAFCGEQVVSTTDKKPDH